MEEGGGDVVLQQSLDYQIRIKDKSVHLKRGEKELCRIGEVVGGACLP